MEYFKKILRFAKPYIKFAWLNVLFNILYAIFNVLSVLAFIPVLGILFGREEKINQKPTFTGIKGIYDYIQNSLNYYVSNMMETGGIEKADILFLDKNYDEPLVVIRFSLLSKLLKRSNNEK